MNKRDFNLNFKYFFKALLIAFIPVMAIIVLAEKYIKNEGVVWLISFVALCVAFLIAFIVKLKKDEKENENPEKKKFDPYSD